jgi:hypothetical protein
LLLACFGLLTAVTSGAVAPTGWPVVKSLEVEASASKAASYCASVAAVIFLPVSVV